MILHQTKFVPWILFQHQYANKEMWSIIERKRQAWYVVFFFRGQPLEPIKDGNIESAADQLFL